MGFKLVIGSWLGVSGALPLKISACVWTLMPQLLIVAVLCLAGPPRHMLSRTSLHLLSGGNAALEAAVWQCQECVCAGASVQLPAVTQQGLLTVPAGGCA